MHIAIFIGIGLVAGVLSGFFGIGGGLVIVPALVSLCAFPLHAAIGTSLGALLLPVGVFGVMEYLKAGRVDTKAALLIACGILIGTYVGARIVQPLSPVLLKRIYAGFLIVVAARMLVGR